jgi:hypothetical protein
MATHRYNYTGQETVHLPEFGILAKGGDKHAVYETDKKLNHPDFDEVKETTRDQRKRAAEKEEAHDAK